MVIVSPSVVVFHVVIKGGFSLTVKIKSLVSLAVPFEIVAVKVTAASPAPEAGRVTVPLLAMTPVLCRNSR